MMSYNLQGEYSIATSVCVNLIKSNTANQAVLHDLGRYMLYTRSHEQRGDPQDWKANLKVVGVGPSQTGSATIISLFCSRF